MLEEVSSLIAMLNNLILVDKWCNGCYNSFLKDQHACNITGNSRKQTKLKKNTLYEGLTIHDFFSNCCIVAVVF